MKSHKPPLEPRPSDRLRIGERIVDVPLREVTPVEGGEPVRITLKSLGVLLALAANPGKPVSRELLLEWVWPGTLPTDDVITQAITQLRKALGDERDRPRYIETIAKQGYRLVASVEWLGDSGEPVAVRTTAEHVAVPAAAAPSRARPRWWWPALAAGAVVLVAGGAWWWQSRDARTPTAAAPLVPTSEDVERIATVVPVDRLTSLKGGERRPSLSPDGALLVYERDGDARTSWLMVQTSQPVPGRELTAPVPGQRDLAPAWSPDGREIAFVRVGQDGRCALMLVAPTGGVPREIGDCLGGGPQFFAWYPDSSALIGSLPQGVGASAATLEKAIYRLPLATGRWERVTYERAKEDEDLNPVVSPDGQWVAFQRNVSLADLWIMPVEGGTPRRLTNLRTNFYGLAWSPDGRALLFGRYGEGGTVLGRLDLATGQLREFAVPRTSLLFPSVARNGEVLAFEVEDPLVVSRRIALDGLNGDPEAGNQRMSTAPKLFEATGSTMHPSIAPDGRQVLFMSNRSGRMRLWWGDQQAPESLRPLDDFRPIARHPVQWDAASQRALAIGVGKEGLGVYEIEPRTGRVTRLPVPGKDPVHVAWHPDPKRLLVVADQDHGRLAVTLYDRSVTPWRALASVPDVSVALADPSNARIVMARMSGPELVAADLALRNVRRVDAVTQQRRSRTLTVADDGVWVMDTGPDCLWRWRRVRDDKGDAPAERCVGNVDWAVVGLSYHPGQDVLYLSSTEDMGADIGLLPLSALSPGEAEGGPQATDP